MKKSKAKSSVESIREEYEALYKRLSEENQLQVGRAVNAMLKASALVTEETKEECKYVSNSLMRYEKMLKNILDRLEKVESTYEKILSKKHSEFEKTAKNSAKKIKEASEFHVESINAQMAGAIQYIGNIITESRYTLGNAYKQSCKGISEAIANEIIKNIKITITQNEDQGDHRSP